MNFWGFIVVTIAVVPAIGEWLFVNHRRRSRYDKGIAEYKRQFPPQR